MMLLEIFSQKVRLLTCKADLLKAINQKNTLLLALNANKFAIEEESFWKSLNENFKVFGYFDGIGAMIRLFIFRNRVPGVELWLDILNNTEHQKIFLFGGRNDVFKESIDILRNRYPTKTFKGINGYSRYEDVLQSICNFNPTLVIAALGSPKQELMLANLRRDASYEFSALGIGGSLDVLVGNITRAPRLIRELGLEGAWRIFLEPKKRFRNVKAIFVMWRTPIRVKHE
jgi:exopolysaccharide biosynthesis WecB/TagA/CpsF family protein